MQIAICKVLRLAAARISTPETEGLTKSCAHQIAQVQGVEEALQGVQQGARAVSFSGILIASNITNGNSLFLQHFDNCVILSFIREFVLDKRPCNFDISGLHTHPRTATLFVLQGKPTLRWEKSTKASLEQEVTSTQGAAKN